MRTRLRLSAALAAALLAAAWTASAAEPTRLVCDRCNVVLVLVDTLRADRLGSYGYTRPTSPRLDAFAASAIRFQNARAQSACTFPSVNSLLTGRHVFPFLAPATRPAIPPAIPSLATLLAAKGYGTAAVSASAIVRRAPSPHNPVGGFGGGFGVFDEACLWREAECVDVRAREVLAGLPRPFFLYLHYLDPHDPYLAPTAERGLFAGPYRGADPAVAAGDPNPIWNRLRAGGALPPAADLAFLSDRYDEEVRSVDAVLGRLFDRLDAEGLAERTMVVVASDHGESFGDGGYVKHCNGVHEAETRVPLLLRVPGLPPGAPAAWVQNVDLVPTLLDYLGVPAPALDGRSLRPLIERGEAPSRHAFTSMGAERAVNDRRHKLVWDAAERRVRLFDLVADPGERRDLSNERRRSARELLDLLRGWLAVAEPGRDDDARAREASELERELRALGYVG